MPTIETSKLTEWRNALDDGLAGNRRLKPAATEVRDGLSIYLNPAPPPPAGRTIITPQRDVTVNRANVSIDSPSDCIMANNGVRVSITLDNFALKAGTGYGIYASPSTRTSLRNGIVESGYYAMRGQHEVWESEGVTYKAGHSVRVYNCRGGFSRGDTFDVNYLRLGGGAANEWENQLPFGGTADAPFVFENGKITARTQVTLYDATQFVDFKHIDFAGTPKVRIELGARNIRFIGCMNLTLDAKGQSIAQLAGRGITITN